LCEDYRENREKSTLSVASLYQYVSEIETIIPCEISEIMREYNLLLG
jgi:hypothetical protein